MNATPSCNYTLRTIQPPTSDQTAYSELMMAGAPTGKVLDGVILEAALTWGPYLLLFVTDDVPYEEILHIYLLDKDLNTQDTAWLGAMYCTGVFSDLDAAGANTVRFRFFGGLAHIDLVAEAIVRTTLLLRSGLHPAPVQVDLQVSPRRPAATVAGSRSATTLVTLPPATLKTPPASPRSRAAPRLPASGTGFR